MFYCVVLNCLKPFYTALYHIILHAAESLLGQPPKMTEEQMENARKRMEENLREDTQQKIERELFTSLLKVLTLPSSSLLHTHTQTDQFESSVLEDNIFDVFTPSH
jgi:hypothetical protein